MSLTKTQVHIAIHFENYKIIKRKLHREVLKSWVPFLTNIYHISKFTFSARQPGFGCSNGLKLDPCLTAEVTDEASETSSLHRLTFLVCRLE